MPDKDLLASIRSQLEDERRLLRSQLDEMGTSGDSSLAFDEGFADSGQVAAELGETRVLAASLADQLQEVERALGKLDDGSYGRCETCGAEISSARLEAMPATRFCIAHA